MKKDEMMQTQMITLGGGCFWCLEAVYQELVGVEHVVSGYAGGFVEFPVMVLQDTLKLYKFILIHKQFP
jgi:peptide methionine sulfoxide reductase MsrA